MANRMDGCRVLSGGNTVILHTSLHRAVGNVDSVLATSAVTFDVRQPSEKKHAARLPKARLRDKCTLVGLPCVG